jgi:UDP-glucose 4-epimerase
VGGLVKRTGLADFSGDQLAFLAFGRAIDTTRMRTVLGLEPAHTSREAFEDFASRLRITVPGADQVGAAASGAAHAISRAFERIQS